MIRRPLAIGAFFRCFIFGAAIAATAAGREAFPIHGQPFIRSYSLGDIGNVPRGSRLSFDRFGRVTAIHEAVYSVLNDNVWLNLAEPGSRDSIPMTNVVQAADGQAYYGARSSWGLTRTGDDGLIHPVPLVPSRCPAWISTAVFATLVPTKGGIYFVSWNGIVYRDFARAENDFYEVPGLSCAFNVGSRLYVSAFGSPLRFIDLDQHRLVSAGGDETNSGTVEVATPLDDTHSLLSYGDGRLMVFDGRRLSPWIVAERSPIKGRISVLQHLVDGRIAMGVIGHGLLVFSPRGELVLALTMVRYSNISALANREPGVLWVGTEDSIDKVVYGNSLSTFGEALGLPVGWPIIARWRGRVYIASGGKLYQSIPVEPGEPTRFELCPNQPPRGTFALAAWGEHMIVGNGAMADEVMADGSFRPIPTIRDLVHLVMIDETHCFAIGRSEIALLEWRGGQWVEPFSRIAGVRNPAVVHRVGRSVWIEMGGDGVARLWVHDGLHLDVVPNHTWTKASWVNIGAIGDIVVLSSLREEPRRYFSEKSGTWVAAPYFEQLLNRSPYWIARVEQDDAGVIWATHNEGIVRFARQGTGYDMDATSFDLVNDLYPIVRVLPDGDVWIYAERSLYHIEREWQTTAPRQPPRPVLVSLDDVQRNRDLLAAGGLPAGALRLPYSSNSLSFRFYSGGDTWRRVPTYEYRLAAEEPWTPFDGSLLSLRTLREGNYRLEVRIPSDHGGDGWPISIDFQISPPWTRSWIAYTLLGLGAILVLAGAICWSTYLTRKRNRLLERMVQDTMAKLNDETRNTATLAERNRLANEIHDSVQQGLTGAILQLDTTLKLPVVTGDMRSRLSVVRNMVSYARQEVQHAVWDMESPLLEGCDLAEALRNLTAFANSGDAEVHVTVTGEVMPLRRDISHNLLRIAQEATTNAFRHARARRISIQLEYSAAPKKVGLEIVDDGIGFRVDDVLHKQTGHLGLRGIRTRAKKIQADLIINSVPQHGTSIRVEVPMAATEPELSNATIYRK